MPNFPSYPYSVILDTRPEKNKFFEDASGIALTNIRKQALDKNIFNAIEMAKTDLKLIIDKQQRLYDKINSWLRSESQKRGKKIDLDILLKDKKYSAYSQPNHSNNKSKTRKNMIRAIKKDLDAELQYYQHSYIQLFNLAKQHQNDRVGPAFNNTFEQVVALVNQTIQKVNALDSRLQNAVETLIEADERSYNISLSSDGEQLFFSTDDKSTTGNINIKQLQEALLKNKARLNDIIANSQTKTRATKGLKVDISTFSSYKSKRHFKQLNQATNQGLNEKDWEEINNELDKLAGSLNTNNIPPSIVSSIIEAVQESLYENKPLNHTFYPPTIQERASKAGFAFEATAHEEMKKILTEAISSDLIKDGVISKRTRIMLKWTPLSDNSSNNAELLKALETKDKELISIINEKILLAEELDKIDDFFLFKESSESNNYFGLAFSDKLYGHSDNITLLGSERGSVDEQTTLLNSLDLLSNLSMPIDTFIFSTLNLSQASLLYSPQRRKELNSYLSDLLASFVYHIAYNPRNFTNYLKEEILLEQPHANIQTLFLHRIGPKNVPSFQILESTLKALEELSDYSKMETAINVEISYNKTKSGLELWHEVREEYLETNDEGKRANKAAPYWNNVAHQIANSIHLRMVMNLAPIFFDAEKLNSII